MFFAELERKWGLSVQILGSDPHPDGTLYWMRVRIGRGPAGEPLDEPQGVRFSLPCPRSHEFDWRDAVYSLSGDLKFLRKDMSYTQFCQVMNLDSRKEETRREYQYVGGWLLRIEQAFPAAFIEDLKYLLIPDVITPAQLPSGPPA
jgi:hypothetical protein